MARSTKGFFHNSLVGYKNPLDNLRNMSKGIKAINKLGERSEAMTRAKKVGVPHQEREKFVKGYTEGKKKMQDALRIASHKAASLAPKKKFKSY